MGKYIIIDDTEYPVAIVEMQRKGDILDLEATRKENGDLQRTVIGTYYNYTLKIMAPGNPQLYHDLWWKLTEPVASHKVQLPYQSEPFYGYFSSCKDNVRLVESDGTFIGTGISCNLTATRKSR